MCKSRLGEAASFIAIKFDDKYTFFLQETFSDRIAYGTDVLLRRYFDRYEIRISGTVFVGDTDRSTQLERPAVVWMVSRKMRKRRDAGAETNTIFF